jgi:hypothetical protein
MRACLFKIITEYSRGENAALTICVIAVPVCTNEASQGLDFSKRLEIHKELSPVLLLHGVAARLFLFFYLELRVQSLIL